MHAIRRGIGKLQPHVASGSRSFSRTPCIRDARSGGSLPKPRLDYDAIFRYYEEKLRNAELRRVAVLKNAKASRTLSDGSPNRRIVSLYHQRQSLTSELGELRQKRSQLEILVRQGGEGRPAAVAEAKELKSRLQLMEKKLDDTESELLGACLALPNDTHPAAPIGPEEAANQLAQHGPEPLPVDPQRHHVSINQSFPFMDLEAGTLSTGSSWYYLKGFGASLELALTNYAMSIAVKHGFTPVMTPDVVKEDIATRCGFQPRDEAGSAPSQNYYLERQAAETKLVLAGTAEIPLGAMFADKILDRKSLPLKVVGLGRAFRAEAGARGADTRGLYRVHQFSKVEMFAVTEGDANISDATMSEMAQIQQEIFDGLGLSFRVLDMPTEELGASAYRKFDMEAWMPGRGGWGEISSLSNCTDYQARRLHIRHYLPVTHESDKEGKRTPSTTFAHTLNGTAAAIPRLIVALIENGAVIDTAGRVSEVKLPSSLRPFWIGSHDRIIWG